MGKKIREHFPEYALLIVFILSVFCFGYMIGATRLKETERELIREKTKSNYYHEAAVYAENIVDKCIETLDTCYEKVCKVYKCEGGPVSATELFKEVY